MAWAKCSSRFFVMEYTRNNGIYVYRRASEQQHAASKAISHVKEKAVRRVENNPTKNDKCCRD